MSAICLAPIYTVRSSWLRVNKSFSSYAAYLLKSEPRAFVRLNHGKYSKLSSSKFINYRSLPFIVQSRTISKKSKASTLDDKTEKAIDDEEFQNVLKDFAKDFDVDGENVKILEDIKKERESGKLDDKNDKEENSGTDETLSAYRSFTKGRFKEFEDSDASIIYSYEEESQLDLEDDFFHIDQEYQRDKIQYEVKRGVTGVYDIHELVAVLRDENLFDIAVIEIPSSYHYADYMVLANAKSPRHAEAVTEFILKFYKKKKGPKDPFVKPEGEKLGSWRAIDMGNIVLHIFLEDARVCYDLEALWLLDPEYDSGGQVQTDSFMDLMKEELEILNALQNTDMPNSEEELTK